MVPARTMLHIHHSGRQRPGPVPALLRILCACFALLIPDQNAHGQVEVVDDMGRTVTLATSAQRIVSLAPSLTESLFAIGAGDQVVGREEFTVYPDFTRKDLVYKIDGIFFPFKDISADFIDVVSSIKDEDILCSLESTFPK